MAKTDKTPPRFARLIGVAILHLFAAMPLRLGHVVGGFLGWLASFLPVRAVQTAEDNIAACFPEKNAAWRRALLREHFVQTGKAFAETARIWLKPGQVTLAKIRKVEGEELLNAARESGDGILLLAPHLGNWEIAANWCTSRFPVTGLYFPGKYPEIDSIMRKAREQYQGTAVPADPAGIKALVKTLATGGVLFILPDQEPLRDAGGEYAPLFGIPALTGVLAPKLAAGRRPIRVLMVYAKRLPKGRGWDLVFRAPDPQVRSSDLQTSVAALNRSVEVLIRECPAQWQWNYKRFKRRPEGTPKVYRLS